MVGKRKKRGAFWKRGVSAGLSLLVILGALWTSARAEETLEGGGEPDWEAFEKFSLEVSGLLADQAKEAYLPTVTLTLEDGTMPTSDGEGTPTENGEGAPIVKDGVLMLPVQRLSESVEAGIFHDGGGSAATVWSEEGELTFAEGEARALLRAQETEEERYIPLEAEPEWIGDSLYVPLDAVADFLGYETERLEDTLVLTRPYQTKRLIVKSPAEELETYGAVREISGFHDLHILQYETEREARNACEKLMAADMVEYVEPDLVVTVAGSHHSWGADYIGADDYNQYLQENTTLDEVVVAVVDTGVDADHELLRDRVIPVDKNFIDKRPECDDGNGHGTHVSGIIADLTLPNVKILPIKSMNEDGEGTELSVYNGAMYAMKQNCDVINMSLSGVGKSKLYEEMVRDAVAQNIPVIVAAGNDYTDARMETPARVEEAITVGAVTANGRRYALSNYGPVIDIWAPGNRILSSIPGGRYEEKSGTSMATPHVAAAAAMLKTYRRDLSPRQIETMLREYGVEREVKNPGGTTKVLYLPNLRELSTELPGEAVSAPTVSLEAGYYQEGQMVSLACETPGAVIRYTLDGTEPTTETGMVYSAPFLLEGSALLKAKAFKSGYVDSYTAERVYYISEYPESLHYQEYNYYDTWTYVCPDKNAKYLKVTFDEDTYLPFPSEWENGSDLDYHRARLRKYGLYLYNGSTLPVNNEYADIDRDYFLYDELSGKSVIIPGYRFSILLNTPLKSGDYGFKIKSVEPLYEKRLSAPEFVTPCGNIYAERQEYSDLMWIDVSFIDYAQNKTVVLNSPEGGDIYYTLDGSLPTRDSLKYDGPIVLDGPRKIRAKAFQDGYVESDTVSETYYTSKYPESLHGQKRDYYFRNTWKWKAPSDVKYMAITFDDKTYLGDTLDYYCLELMIYDKPDLNPGFPTKYKGRELAGRTIYVKGNSITLGCEGWLPEGIECPYGFKITDIRYYYNEDDLIPIESIEIVGPDSVMVGRQAQMKAVITPENANVGFIWRLGLYDNHSSIDENGVLTGESVGSASLMATSNMVNTIDDDGSYYENGSGKDISIVEEAEPGGTIRYSTQDPTNQDVIATVVPEDGSIRVANNGGNDSYTFHANGQFTFQLVSVTGKKGSVTAEVDWIDKTAPTAELSCTPETATNGNVTVTMTPSEEVTVTSPSDGSRTVTVAENGRVRFEFTDRAGNTGFAEKEITWIDKEPPVITLRGENPQRIREGWRYIEQGAAVTDNMDPDIGKKLTIKNASEIDTSVSGSYEVTYEARDQAGNLTTVTRTVIVEERAEHIHQYGAEWKRDDKNHWQECVGCGEQGNRAPHTEDAGTVTKEPTTEETGLKAYECSVCGQELRQEILPKLTPSHTHSFSSDWKKNGTHHWHECACGEKRDLELHAWGNGVVTKAPTAADPGIRTYTCTACGAVKTENIPAMGGDSSDDDDSSGGGSVSGSGTSTPREEHPSVPEKEPPKEDVSNQAAPLPFEDVKETAWYYTAVAVMYDQKLMTGITETRFRPEGTTTRGEVATILHRLEGVPTTEAKEFLDVAPEAYYAPAVAWASEAELIKGYGDGTFRPDLPITRQELATVLYRYGAWKGWDTTARADLSGFCDIEQIGAYAWEPLAWAKATEIITGTDWGGIHPGGYATRGETAAILSRILSMSLTSENEKGALAK